MRYEGDKSVIETYFDNLKCHLGRDVDALNVVLSRFTMLALLRESCCQDKMFVTFSKAKESTRSSLRTPCVLYRLRSTSVPFLAGKGPPSKTRYGVIL